MIDRVGYDKTAKSPLEHVFDAIFTFYPSPTDDNEEDWAQERCTNFEHMIDDETGKVTKYSKWYIKWAIQKRGEPMQIDMESKKNVFRRSWHSNQGLVRQKERREGRARCGADGGEVVKDRKIS